MSDLFWVKCNYNANFDETKIRTSKNWQELPTIHQLDALGDMIELLTEFYDKTCNEFSKGNIEGTKAILIPISDLDKINE